MLSGKNIGYELHIGINNYKGNKSHSKCTFCEKCLVVELGQP